MNPPATVFRWGSIAAVGAIVARTAWTRASGLNPQSFWFDDVWVASLTRLDSLWAAVVVPALVPPAFLGALWITARLISDPEVALQLIPFVGAFLTIPLLAYLVGTLTGSRALGVMSAGLLALNENSAHYSIFVKSYVTDQLATVVFLLVAVWVFRKRQSSESGTIKHQRLAAAALLGVVMVFWSLPSVFSSAALFTVATLGTFRVSGADMRRHWPALCIAGVFGFLLSLSYLFVLLPRSHAELVDFWRNQFVPLDSFAGSWAFLASSGWGGLQGALPLLLRPITPLVAVGALWLLVRREHRPLGAYLLLFFAAIVVASALRVHPIGGGQTGAPALSRTDLFSYPATILLFTLGIHALTRALPAHRWINGALSSAMVWLALSAPIPVAYYELNHSAFPRFVSALAAPDDAVILTANGSYLAGFYSSWPIAAKPSHSTSNGFVVHLDRPHSLTLHERRPEELESFLNVREYERVFYFTTREDREIPESLLEILNRHGYAERERYNSNIRTNLLIFEQRRGR